MTNQNVKALESKQYIEYRGLAGIDLRLNHVNVAMTQTNTYMHCYIIEC